MAHLCTYQSFAPPTPIRECEEIGGDLTFLKGDFSYILWGKIFGLIPSYPYIPPSKKVGLERFEDKKWALRTEM